MENLCAPRAKFERIYIISPIKVAIQCLTIVHCLFLFISFLTSFWIETNSGHYGPLYRCEKHLILKSIQCFFGGFISDIYIFQNLSLIFVLLILSFILSILSIIFSCLSFIKTSFAIRHRYWLCTIFLLLFICLIDGFILIFIPLSYDQQFYKLQWSYDLHCVGTLLIFISLISAILTHNTDDVQYIEKIIF